MLKQVGRGSTGSLGVRLRHVLGAAEVALATVLLIGAGLLIQSFVNLQRVHLGFDSHALLTFQLAPPTAKYPLNSKALIFYRTLLDSLQSLPGVSGVAVSSGILFGVGNYTTHPMLTTSQSICLPAQWCRLIGES